jgi:hypothetical protein
MPNTTAPAGVALARLRSAADLISKAAKELEYPELDLLPPAAAARSSLAAAAFRVRLALARAKNAVAE